MFGKKLFISKFILNSQTTFIPTSSFLPLAEFFFLSQLAVVSPNRAHITCVILVALDPKLQILSQMQTLSSHGWMNIPVIQALVDQ